MPFLGDVLIGLGLFLGGVITGAAVVLDWKKPGRLCTCGHYKADHIDAAGVCDATETCDCTVFVYQLDARKFGGVIESTERRP